eukprot:17447-Heterocapsa_arctica.AAC.1
MRTIPGANEDTWRSSIQVEGRPHGITRYAWTAQDSWPSGTSGGDVVDTVAVAAKMETTQEYVTYTRLLSGGMLKRSQRRKGSISKWTTPRSRQPGEQLKRQGSR